MFHENKKPSSCTNVYDSSNFFRQVSVDATVSVWSESQFLFLMRNYGRIWNTDTTSVVEPDILAGVRAS